MIRLRSKNSQKATNGTNGTTDTATKKKYDIRPFWGQAGTKAEWKRIDEIYDDSKHIWVLRNAAPFTGKEVATRHFVMVTLLTRSRTMTPTAITASC